jgi:hypothetical protein
MNKDNANGFQVYVHEGREVSKERAAELRASETDATPPAQRVKERVNGPHHDAKWVRDRVKRTLIVDQERTEFQLAGIDLKGQFRSVVKGRTHFKEVVS